MSAPSPLRTPTALRRIYRGLAPFYDHMVPLVSSRPRRTGCEWVQVQDGEQVLDVGTGTGLALRRLVAANPSGWTEGLDASPAMLTHARRRLRTCPHRRYGLRVGDATALPLRDDAVDGVVFDAPYGRQSKIEGDLDGLVADALAEAHRVASRAVVVGDRSWAATAEAAGWTVKATFERRVHRSLVRYIAVLL